MASANYHRLRKEEKKAWSEYYAAIERKESQAGIDRLGNFAELMSVIVEMETHVTAIEGLLDKVEEN